MKLYQAIKVVKEVWVLWDRAEVFHYIQITYLFSLFHRAF